MLSKTNDAPKKSWGSAKGLCPIHPNAYCTLLNQLAQKQFICYRCRADTHTLSPPTTKPTSPVTNQSKSRTGSRKLHPSQIPIIGGNLSSLVPGLADEPDQPVIEAIAEPEEVSTEEVTPAAATEAAAPDAEAAADEPAVESPAEEQVAISVGDALLLPVEEVEESQVTTVMRQTAELEESFGRVASIRMELGRLQQQASLKRIPVQEGGQQEEEIEAGASIDVPSTEVPGFYVIDKAFTYADYLKLIVGK